MSERFVYCSSERRYGLRLVVGQNLILMGRYEKSVRFAAVLVGCVLRGFGTREKLSTSSYYGHDWGFYASSVESLLPPKLYGTFGSSGYMVIYHRSQSTDIFRLSCIRIRNRGRWTTSRI